MELQQWYLEHRAELLKNYGSNAFLLLYKDQSGEIEYLIGERREELEKSAKQFTEFYLVRIGGALPLEVLTSDFSAESQKRWEEMLEQPAWRRWLRQQSRVCGGCGGRATVTLQNNRVQVVCNRMIRGSEMTKTGKTKQINLHSQCGWCVEF